MNKNFNNSSKIIWLLVTSFIVSLILALYLTTPKQSELEILSTDFAASSTEQNTLDQSDVVIIMKPVLIRSQRKKEKEAVKNKKVASTSW